MNRRGLLLVVMLSLYSDAFASTIDNTKIISILAGEVYGNKVFLEIDPKPSSVPSCQTNPDYNFMFDASTDVGKATLSMALTAYSAQKKVYFDGYNTCGTGGVENLKQIWIK